jgi:hypothetical protein
MVSYLGHHGGTRYEIVFATGDVAEVGEGSDQWGAGSMALMLWLDW